MKDITNELAAQNRDKNKITWEYNIPLQVWPIHKDPENETTPIIGWEILNYMPRKERVVRLNLEEVLGGQTREEYMNTAAIYYERMAEMFREAAKNKSRIIYYHTD
jgi:hypothetical protein